MSDSRGVSPAALQKRLDRYLAVRPDVALMAPFFAYLLLLALRDFLPYEQRAVASVIRGVGALAVVWLVRRHLPPWGKPHWLLAIPAGVLAAAGWVSGQHFFDHLGLPHTLPLPLFGGETEIVDPRDQLGTGALFWTTVVARVTVATTTVAIVEELFWRAFMLRALINWSEFEKVPLGKFTWFSFIGTSLISTLEHPSNWIVSIFCWMAFNALFYWKRSILFLVLVHGITNLVLYVYVVGTNDWIFW
ncbi:MAG: CAAX prenyl protease-related protein [Phycisphaerae bacterium]|nr:CAAX prenyl protease-related protein [Phycisphaerae bacterium]